MRVFQSPNYGPDNSWTCPLCNQSTNKPVVLVPIKGTEDDGNVQAQQIHYQCCLDLAGQLAKMITT